MKVSELIAALQAMHKEHGDLPVELMFGRDGVKPLHEVKRLGSLPPTRVLKGGVVRPDFSKCTFVCALMTEDTPFSFEKRHG
jgi:hypothetical protein